MNRTNKSTGRTSSARRKQYSPDEIDQYNYIDRDIYSHSRDTRSSEAYGGSVSRSARGRAKPRKRRRGCLGRLAVAFFSVLILVALTGITYSIIMFSRLDRTPDATSSQMAGYIQQPSEAPAWDVKSDGSVMNVLLIGADENDDGTDGRSDTNILLSIDSKNKALRLVSFLRDTYLEIPTVGKNKLNAAYSNGGAALTMQTLENNYRINIDKYISVDFDSFATLIDKMGGLDVPMSASACREENANMGTHLKAGVNHLNGKLCLYYARIRNATDDFGSNDYGRTGRQRQIVELMVQKMKSMNPIELNKVMYDYLHLVKTNLSNSELVYLASIGVTVSGYQIEQQQMPAPNTFDDQESIKGIGKVITLDLEENCSILRKFLYGDDAESSESGQ